MGKHGLTLTGEFVRVEQRTVSPREGGKSFETFRRDAVRLLLDKQYPRTVEYREGTMPPKYRELAAGAEVTIPVYVQSFVKGVPYFNGTDALDGGGGNGKG